MAHRPLAGAFAAAVPARRHARVLAVLLFLSSGGVLAHEPPASALKTLYDDHDWSELGRRLEGADAPALFGAAVAVVFNDPRAEAQLRSVIEASPRSDEAYEAYEWLSHLYLRDGQYHRLTEAMKKRWATFPGRESEKGERDTLAPFQGLPDQAGAAQGPTTIPHDGSIFVPVLVQGGSAKYFFDTGAWLSCMSESEAKRLGLTVRSAEGTLGTSTGASVGLRTTVARDVVVGGARFENVSFAVFPDDQEPWSVLPAGQRGILGMPLLVGLRSLRWSQDGKVTFGQKPGALDVRTADLFFEEDHLLAAVGFQKERVLLNLDTGAETTDLYDGFAKRFTALLEKAGRKGTQEVRGVGKAESFDAITVPELGFEVGGLETSLRPANVLRKSIGAKRSLGNLGLDLLKQGKAFRIDFGSMTLELEPKP